MGVVEQSPTPVLSLTERLEVLASIAVGLSYQEIAARVFLGVKRVETVCRTVFAKPEDRNGNRCAKAAVTFLRRVN